MYGIIMRLANPIRLGLNNENTFTEFDRRSLRRSLGPSEGLVT